MFELEKNKTEDQKFISFPRNHTQNRAGGTLATFKIRNGGKKIAKKLILFSSKFLKSHIH